MIGAEEQLNKQWDKLDHQRILLLITLIPVIAQNVFSPDDTVPSVPKVTGRRFGRQREGALVPKGLVSG